MVTLDFYLAVVENLLPCETRVLQFLHLTIDLNVYCLKLFGCQPLERPCWPTVGLNKISLVVTYSLLLFLRSHVLIVMVEKASKEVSLILFKPDCTVFKVFRLPSFSLTQTFLFLVSIK